MAQVICNDGTVEEEAIENCVNHGGVTGLYVEEEATKTFGEPAPNGEPAPSELAPADKDLTSTQKWGLVIGLTLVAYFILYKAGSLK